MLATSRRILIRIGRWPRRIAALACLLCAAGSAVAGHSSASPTQRRLRAGQVAVPVAVQAAAEVSAGDHVGVLVTAGSATLIADRLRVLSVRAASSVAGDATAVVTVATDRAHALVLARYAGRALMLISDDVP